MILTDLPTEVLLQITSELDDVFEFIRLASVCKKLQLLVKSIVLIVSDSSQQSSLFQTISKDFIQLQIRNSLEFHNHWRKTFEKFQYFIFEYHSVELNAVLAEYISLITDLKSKPSQKIDVIYMNSNAATISRAIIFDPRTFIPSKLSQVSRTLYFGDSDQGLNTLLGDGFAPEALLLMGHTYHFDSIDHLPQLYVYANQRFPFKIISSSVTSIDGITNVNDQLPRFPTLSNFLKYSYIPNLNSLIGIGIESGTSLELFQRFQNLKTLELDSVFTSDVRNSINHPKVTLPNLSKLKISGNSISLSNISLPNLKILDITIRGSTTERVFDSILVIQDLQTPNLEELYISSSNVPNGPLYILSHIDLSNLRLLYVFSSTLSTFPKLEYFSFPKLKEVKLGTFYVSQDDLFELQPFKLDAPNLRILNLKNLESFNNVLLNNVPFKGLEELYIQLKVHPEEQNYEFTTSNFPDLKILNMGFFNKFGKLVTNNIKLKINLPKLKKLSTKNEVLDCIDGDLEGVEIEKLENTSFARLNLGRQ
ncbi:Internalin-I [Wickerhamomyces ciferrii]|uniref:Internalin-I n=1 Tax=Wickerhamomyces ciferrii (strain ATCC 14091 / BCRC 22168 / CBS 111 / JCM 3599 / NBRC 0793 / NRRL Y-1031 F-60-10) TaxID=1206466 RepID=K0K8N1_WICCF|nr:Internalin-I [Wickerhamomyces ciferrii]CCH41195.1 Internalin-I [Wickerhamomyces ciferrii]